MFNRHRISDNIQHQTNPLLSSEYLVNWLGTQFWFETITPVIVERALKKMKTSFGFASDSIASYFLKITFLVITSSLCKSFDFSIETGIFSDACKEACVSRVFKGGQC